MKKSSLIIFTLLFVSSVFSQSDRSLEYSGAFDTYYYRGPVKLVAGLGMGGVNNKLTKGLAVKEPSPFGLIGLAYQWFPRSIFVTELSYIKLNQTDKTIDGSLDFTNIELNVHGRFYLLDKRVTRKLQKDKPKLVRPYVMAGVSVGRYSSTYTVAGTTILSEKGPRAGFASLFGFGFAFQVSNFFSIAPEISKRVWLSNNESSKILDGYTVAGVKVHYNPWAKKKIKKHSFEPPLTPTLFNSPHGVGANDKRRKKESEGVVPTEDEFELPAEEESEDEDTEESDPFGDFEKDNKEEKDPFDF